MNPDDEGYRERYIASTLDAFCFLQSVCDDANATHYRVITMDKDQMITLIGGLTSICGIFVNNVAEQKDCSTKDALIFIGRNLAIGEEDS